MYSKQTNEILNKVLELMEEEEFGAMEKGMVSLSFIQSFLTLELMGEQSKRSKEARMNKETEPKEPTNEYYNQLSDILKDTMNTKLRQNTKDEAEIETKTKWRDG